MSVKKYKPTTPGRRFASVSDYTVLRAAKTSTPKALLVSKSKASGRNNSGKITVRHRGGGARKKIRVVDFNRSDRKDIPATVKSIEYDPTRTSFIARVAYMDGAQRYILAPVDLKVGDKVMYSETAEIHPGNRLSLQNMPVGTFVHDIELVPGKGGQMARSAGSYALLQTIDAGYALLKLPSGEIRKVRTTCTASVGQLSNAEHMNVRLGKAGRRRHQGFRPTVRGKVMNPVDHPHGGGEGSNPIGLKYPKTPWGKHALGVRTRQKRKGSSKFIVKKRGKK